MVRRTPGWLGVGLLVMILASSPVAAAPGPKFGDWAEPVNLGSGINSAFSDDGPAISKDGLSLYFNSTRPGGSGGQDIWVAQRANEDDAWGAPMNLAAVNTAVTEQAPAFSSDGHHMFFVSDRAGGAGGLDIWVSTREDKHDDFAWQAPVNLAAVNTSSTDAGPGWLRDGDEEVLFITSNRPGGSGGADIYASLRQEDGSFGTPVAVAELNSPVQDARAAPRRDGRELFLFSPRAGSFGATDLWTSMRENRRAPWSSPVNLGAVVNSSADEMQPALSRDGRTLFFASNRPGGSGLLDLYMSTRTIGD